MVKKSLLVYCILLLLCPLSHAQTDVLDLVDQLLQAGRFREAHQYLQTIKRIETDLSTNPRFLYLESRCLVLNGFAEEALARLEALRDIPQWEDQVNPDTLTAVEIQVYQSLGQATDALALIEQRLIPLDELDPPFSSEITQLYLTYADLLMACSRSREAGEVLFSLARDGDPSRKPLIAESLLKLSNEVAFSPEQIRQLPSLLGEIRGVPLWHRFALAVFEQGDVENALNLFKKGLETSGPVLRAIWPDFLAETTNTPFLTKIVELLQQQTQQGSPGVLASARALTAMTLEKIGRTDEALGLIQDMGVNDVDLQLFAARIHAAKGDIASASQIFANLETLSPGNFYDDWGSLLIDHGKTEEGLAVLAKRVQVPNPRPEDFRAWSMSLRRKGFPHEALDAIHQGIKLTSDPSYFAYDLLDVSLSISDVEGALSAYQMLRTGKGSREQIIWSSPRLLEELRRSQQMEIFADKLNSVLDATTTIQQNWRDLAVDLATDLNLNLNRIETLSTWLKNPPVVLKAYWDSAPERRSTWLINTAMELSFNGEDELASQYYSQIDPVRMQERPDVLEQAARTWLASGKVKAALELWEQLLTDPRIIGDQKGLIALTLAQIYLDQFQPGRALDTLNTLQSLNLPPSFQSESTFLRALAHTQLHEKSKAIPFLEETLALGSLRANDARFWLGEWALWQRNKEEAQGLYREVLANDPGQELANEALLRLRHLSELEEDQLPPYALGTFFEVSGDWIEAEKNFRALAATVDSPSLTDWIYFHIGRILIRSGRVEEGIKQWDILKDKTANKVWAERIELERAMTIESASTALFQKIVLTTPDSLVGDLARERIRTGLTPSPPITVSEPVP